MEFGSSHRDEVDDDDKENTDSNPRDDDASQPNGTADDDDDVGASDVMRQSMLLATQDLHLEMEDTEESQSQQPVATP